METNKIIEVTEKIIFDFNYLTTSKTTLEFTSSSPITFPKAGKLPVSGTRPPIDRQPRHVV
jgi:hypothetical protein